MDIDVLSYLDADSILLDLKPKSKKNVLSVILDHLIQKKKVKKEYKKELLKLIIQREEMGSTAIGGHIALPHARTERVKNIVICFAISNIGLDFDSLDQEPIYVITLLLSNQKEAGAHLKMLAFLARMLRDRYFIQQLKNIKSKEAVLELISKQQQVVR